MDDPPATRLSGRRAEAQRNDTRVLEAAHEVFTADPDAPMAAVAAKAGVGQGSLYRRYPSKEALLSEVCRRGMEGARERATAARHDDGDPWEAFEGFLRWYLGSGTAQLSALIGAFSPDDSLFELARAGNEAIEELVQRTIAAGVLRPGVSGADLGLLALMVGGLHYSGPERDAALRERYLTLILQGLALTDAEPLPGEPPDAAELERPWEDARAAGDPAEPSR